MLWPSKKHTADTQKPERKKKTERQNERNEQAHGKKVIHCIDVG